MDVTLRRSPREIIRSRSINHRPIRPPTPPNLPHRSHSHSRRRSKSKCQTPHQNNHNTFCISVRMRVSFLSNGSCQMALGTPNESYDSEAASLMLKSVGEQHVKIASTDLLDRGVLSKLVRDPSKPKPGRTLRISEA